MRKFLTLILLHLITCFSSFCQKLPNTLLWKITGNGLQKPSYLYGTMHLTDERLFNLGDSLYKAIESSEGFAIEVNPEQMTAYLIDEISNEIKNAVSIKMLLNEKEFKKYGPVLSKKLKKPAEQITTRDIFLEKNKWVQESFKKGTMSTFLDAYLFDIARRQGKWTGGVEDIDDQKGLMDDLVDKSDIKQLATSNSDDSKENPDNFIKLYSNSNLNAIDSISNTGDSAYLDALLIKRNAKMARRMDSLAKIRSMVFAVGAAHLPGKEGVISLLKNNGFDVQPVFSSKKVKPADYKVKEVDVPWITVNDPDSFYSVDMPGKPGDIEMFGVLKMKMHFDIFTSSGYMVTSIATPLDKKGVDSLMNFYSLNLFKGNKPQNAKPVTINGITGKELAATDENGYKHGYILYKNHILYLALGIAVKKTTLSENNLNRFLSTYHPMERKENNAAAYTYVDSLHLFKIDLPAKPQSGNDLAGVNKDKSINTKLMISLDSKTGGYFFFAASEAAPGYFIENDSTTIASIESNTKEKYSSISLDTIYINEGKRILKLEGVMAKANVFAKSYYQLYGNRWYALLAMYDTARENSNVDQFFHSFQNLNLPPINWKYQFSEDKSISGWMPDVIRKYNNDSSEDAYSRKYESYDSTQANSYDIVVSGLSRYYWQNSDSAFWNSLQKSNDNGIDSVLSERRVTNGNVKGIEIQSRKAGSFNIKRKRILLYGDTLYTLLTVLPVKYINDSNSNKFFDDFKFLKTSPVSSIFTSKAKQLLNDLDDKDSAISAEAQQAIITANFRTNDLPLLYKALLNAYSHNRNPYRTINQEIAEAIKMIKDSSSLRIAKENYANVTNRQIKSLLLDIISGYKTKENYNDLKKLLMQYPPDTALSYTFTSNLKDSLALAANFINGTLALLKDTSTAPAIIDIVATLVDSNIISTSILEPYYIDIISFADYRYHTLKRDSSNYNYQDIYVIELLGKMNTLQSNAMLQKWLLINGYLKIRCAEALLTNGQTVASSTLLKLAADKYYRVSLYSTLKKLKKQNLFPKQYLTQQYFAESKVYDAAGEDDEPSSVTYLTQKIVMFQGKKSRFFFYKITYGEEDEKTYTLACAGPFDPDILNMSEEKANGYLYYKEDFDKANLQQQINGLIKQAEDETDNY